MASAAQQPRPGNGSRPFHGVRWLFPIALLLFGGFFFGGHLGWWSDDYWHCLRDPVSGAVRAWVMDRGFFLRPLFYVVVPAVTTAFWNHDWIAHAIQLAVHGGVVALLWRWLMMLGIARPAAGAAALLFMIYPAQFEALFWVAALPTAISAAVMLVVLMMAMRWQAEPRASAWMRLGLMSGLTFVACCLNEQPAAAVAAMPLLAWLLRSHPHPGVPEKTRWRSIFAPLLPTLACGLAGMIYAILRITDSRAPRGARGSAETFVAAARLWERTTYFCDVLWRRLVMKNWASGALHEGWNQVIGTWWGWIALAVVIALGLFWACAGRGSEEATQAQPAPEGTVRPKACRLLVLGLAIFVSGWLPILLMAVYEPDSRCRYWPNIGLALAAAAMFDAAARRAATTRARVIAARLMLALVLVVWSVMLIGAQSGFRNRWRLDQAESEELRRLVPNPVPYTFFVPLNIEERALQTGSPVLDTHFRSVWEFPWTTPNWIQRIYTRDDVRCGYWRHWTPGVPVKGADNAGIHYADTLGPRFPDLPDGTRLIPWDRAVIYTIGKDRVLRVATRVILEGPGPERVIELPQAKGLPEMTVRLKGL